MSKAWQSLIFVLLGWLILSGCANPKDSSAQAIATPTTGADLLATSQALSTSIARNASLIATAEAQKTQISRTPSPTPVPTLRDPGADLTATTLAPVQIQDLPLPMVEKIDYFESHNQITFLVAGDLQSLVLFFENQIPLKGWRKEIQGSFTTDGSALLNYVRNNQKLSISLRFNPISQRTAVILLLSD
jgi:uncharacterized lipoprotein NlpE involved in copper resistance